MTIARNVLDLMRNTPLVGLKGREQQEEGQKGAHVHILQRVPEQKHREKLTRSSPCARIVVRGGAVW